MVRIPNVAGDDGNLAANATTLLAGPGRPGPVITWRRPVKKRHRGTNAEVVVMVVDCGAGTCGNPCFRGVVSIASASVHPMAGLAASRLSATIPSFFRDGKGVRSERVKTPFRDVTDDIVEAEAVRSKSPDRCGDFQKSITLGDDIDKIRRAKN